MVSSDELIFSNDLIHIFMCSLNKQCVVHAGIIFQMFIYALVIKNNVNSF